MQPNSFDLLANLPLIFFSILFAVDFVIFLVGGIKFLLARGDVLKIDGAKKILKNAFKVFLSALVIFLIFTIISSILKRGEVLVARESASPDFPPANHLGNFPGPVNYLRLGDYYFNGPFTFKDNFAISRYAISAILCKNNDNYDLIFVGETSKENLMQNVNYKCWTSKCSAQNMYLAVFWTPTERYSTTNKTEIVQNVKSAMNPPCLGQE